MRALYKADPQLWIDLVEQAASEVGDVVLVCDECGPERPGAGEAFVHCHRRLLKALPIVVAMDRGLMVDPDTDALDRTLLEVRRTAALAAAGFPSPARSAAARRTPRRRAAGSRRSTPGPAYFNEVDKGGHFAAWEEPARFATELRAAFRSLR